MLITKHQKQVVLEIPETTTKLLVFGVLFSTSLIFVLRKVVVIKATTVLNTKIIEVENKTPNANSSVTTTVLNTKTSEIEKKIPDNSKYITTQEFNKLTAECFTSRLKQADLVIKIDFDNKLISFNKIIASNKTKHLEVHKN